MNEKKIQQEFDCLKQQMQKFSELLIQLCEVIKELAVALSIETKSESEEIAKLCQQKIKR
jgi:hypothetical protein